MNVRAARPHSRQSGNEMSDIGMNRWIGKVAIVTGASSGIGAEIAEALVREGLKVAGLARRVEKIRQIADKLKGEKGELYPIECDVEKENDILKVFEWIEKRFGGVDVLINNAGVLSREPIIGKSLLDPSNPMHR